MRRFTAYILIEKTETNQYIAFIVLYILYSEKQLKDIKIIFTL